MADAEIGGDILARVARQDQLHNLVLPRRQALDAIGRVCTRGQQRAQDLLLLDQLLVLMTQIFFPQQRLPQPALLLSQFKFVTRDRAVRRAGNAAVHNGANWATSVSGSCGPFFIGGRGNQPNVR